LEIVECFESSAPALSIPIAPSKIDLIVSAQ
jgi:hypothetical protein